MKCECNTEMKKVSQNGSVRVFWCPNCGNKKVEKMERIIEKKPNFLKRLFNK